MTLRSAEIGMIYKVNYLNLEKTVMRRLEALGLTKGTDVKVLNRNKEGSVILMVRGSRLALGSKIAETIHTREAAK